VPCGRPVGALYAPPGGEVVRLPAPLAPELRPQKGRTAARRNPCPERAVSPRPGATGRRAARRTGPSCWPHIVPAPLARRLPCGTWSRACRPAA